MKQRPLPWIIVLWAPSFVSHRSPPFLATQDTLKLTSDPLFNSASIGCLSCSAAQPWWPAPLSKSAIPFFWGAVWSVLTRMTSVKVCRQLRDERVCSHEWQVTKSQNRPNLATGHGIFTLAHDKTLAHSWNGRLSHFAVNLEVSWWWLSGLLSIYIFKRWDDVWLVPVRDLAPWSWATGFPQLMRYRPHCHGHP